VGSSICTHNREKLRYKEGKGIYEHNRQKQVCKKCFKDNTIPEVEEYSKEEYEICLFLEKTKNDRVL
jgi:hypothetical protein